MLQGEHYAILSNCIKLPFLIKTFFLSILSGRFKQVLLHFLKVEEADVLLILHQKPKLALEKLKQLPSGRFAGKHSFRE